MSDELPYAKPAAKEKRRKRVKAVSDRQRQRIALYRLLKTAYIVGVTNGQEFEEPMCERCRNEPGTVLHHKRGRVGNNLLNPSTFVLLGDKCHTWIHAHPEQAMKQGWMESRH